MRRRQIHPEQFGTLRAPGPRMGAWLALLLLTATELGGVLVAVANRPGRIEGGWLRQAVLTLGASPLAAAVAAFVGLITAVYAFRRIRLRRLAWQPGPIEVSGFAVDATLGGSNHAQMPVRQLNMHFRERLAAVHLQAPDAFPSTPESQDFLTLLTSAARTPTNILGTIAGLLISMLPKSAYRVHGTLLRRVGDEPCGVVVQVIVAPRYASAPMFTWATTFEAAVEQAAYAVAAYLLPRTAACRHSPWTAWSGIEMPSRLVARGTQASGAAAGRRYDEALAAYFDAIEADPRNLALRFEVGLLQEKLALWLDAYATYDDLVGLAEASLPCRPPLRAHAFRPAALRRWRGDMRVLIHARYRRAVLLGFGEQLATQWARQPYRRGMNERRRLERRALIVRLQPQFLREASRLGDKLCGWGEQPEFSTAIDDVAAILDKHDGFDDPPSEVRLRELFAFSSERRLQELDDQLGSTWTRWAAGSLTRRSVRTAAAWAGLRASYARVLLEKEPALPTLDKIETLVEKCLPSSATGDWQASYNAACAYAVALVPDPKRVREACDRDERHHYHDDERTQLAERAIARLENSVKQLGSGALARRRAWIVSQDPDLSGLRGMDCFATFEARYFPGERATPPRPANVHYLELARYSRHLLLVAAHSFADEWRDREAACRRDSDPSGVHLLHWLLQEREAVERFCVAATENRHWQTRARTLHDLERWAAARGRALTPISVRDYGARPLELNGPPVHDLEEQLNREARDVFDKLERAIHAASEGAGACDHHARWLDAVKASSWTSPVATLCHDRARWWEWAGDVLKADPGARPRRPQMTAPHRPRLRVPRWQRP